MDNAALQNPNANALAAPSLTRTYECLTYKELKENIERFGNRLKQLGVREQDKVLVLLPLSTEFYTLLIAIFRIGAVAVVYEPKDISWQIHQTIGDLRPSFTITTKSIHRFLSLNKSYRTIPKKIMLHHFLKNLPSGPCTPSPVFPSSHSLITFTSGSEGTPKGIVRTHSFLKQQHLALHRHMQFSEKDHILTTLPIFVLSMFASGAFAIIPQLKKSLPWKPERNTQQIIEDYNVSVIVGASAFIHQLLRSAHSLKHIKKVIIGGCFLEKQLISKLKTALSEDAAIEIIYGSTEAEPVSYLNIEELHSQWELYAKKGYCVGKPVKDVQTRIIPFKKGPLSTKDIIPLSQGEIGELLVSGKHVNDQYFPLEPAFSNNKVLDEKGILWHRMGDGAYLDKYGHVWLVGRYKHLPEIVLQNFEKYLELQNSLQSLKGVHNVLLTGPSSSLNLYIETSISRLRSRKKMKQQAKSFSKMCGFTPTKITLVKSMPKDRRHNSKINYSEFISNKK